MASSSGFERFKDILLEHVLRDVKELQRSQSDREQMEDVVTLSSNHVQALCEHLDRILMHGLRSSVMGYWSAVSYFTRSEAVGIISQLHSIKTSVGRGRAWLYLALNEQSLESYFRMFIENQDIMQEYYLRDSFLRDLERLVVLQTLMAGLDFISFDLPIDSIYLDYGATKATATVGTLKSNNITPDITPTFISVVTPTSGASDKISLSSSSDSPAKTNTGQSPGAGDGFSLTGVISNVFSKKKEKGVRDRSSPPTSTAAAGGKPSPVTGRGKDGGVASSLEGEAELQDSFSPHRTLLQSESHGTGQAAGSVESGSGSYSPHSSLSRPVTQEEAFRVRSMPQQSREGVGGGEEELVQHTKSKSGKGKAKKKKKKKKPKAVDSDESQPASSSISVDRNQGESNATESQTHQSSVSHPPRNEAGGDSNSSELNKTGDASLSTLREDDDTVTQRIPMGSPEDDEIPWEQFHPGASEGRLGTSEDHFPPQDHQQGEYMEECDMGFGQEIPLLPPPQSAETSKRLSLADELELAMEGSTPIDPNGDGDTRKVSRPHPPLGQPIDDNHEQTMPTTVHTEATPFPGSTHNEFTQAHDEQESVQTHTPPSEPFRYDSSPNRPSEITEKDKRDNDMEIDDTAQLVISLDVLHREEEDLHRLVQVATPTGVGQQRTCYVLITSHCTYILRKDGIEGNYSREISIDYNEYDHIVVGLSWQSLHLLYRDANSPSSEAVKEYILLTGSEAVSRGIVDSIRASAAACPGFMRSIPLNKDDEARVEAIEKELIKLGSETSMDIVQYLLVNWEQLSDDVLTASLGPEEGVSRSGYLLVKTTTLLGYATWRQAYFTVRNGVLHQFSSEEDDVAKNSYQIRNCGGCVRASAENKQFALTILGEDKSVMVVLAASDEEELTQWMQTLCEAVIEREMPGSPTMRKACFFCALLLTQNKVHVLQEDWINKTVQLVASCSVMDVNDISVDKTLPLYCTISYDHENDQGLWLICFNTEYELGKFEAALSGMWREEFQVDLKFSEVSDMLTRQRAHKAVELMQGSKFRSDSMTRGRTEFTYSTHY